MKYLYTLFFICIYFLSNAQIDFNQYKLQQCSGQIPDDFLGLLVEKYEEDRQNIDRTVKRSVRKTQDRFFLKSNYLIGELLQSGRILFNDPVTEYVNKVAQNLLEPYPELQDEVRIYISRSPAVNAFATDKGIIFVNMGLIAQITNEAELAYILAHEIVHYAEKHNMDLYVLNDLISRNERNFKYVSVDDEILDRNHWSKEVELEADEKALVKYYSKSNYTPDALRGVFDVLQYSYLPFDNLPFDKAFFESEYFSLPVNLFLDKVDDIKVDESYDDSKSTHPNTQKRRLRVLSKANNFDRENKVEFIEPRETFDYVQKIARFEVIHEQLVNRSYVEALYNSYLLLKIYPDNKYLQRSIASSLYMLAKYKNEGDLGDVLPYYSDVEGESQQLYYMFYSMTKVEHNVLALNYAWKLKQQYTGDTYLNRICDDLFEMLITKNNLGVFDFSRKPRKSDQESDEGANEEVDSTDGVKINKYDRIKRGTNEEEDLDWTNYAFVDFFKDPDFVKKFEDMTYDLEKEEEEVEEKAVGKQYEKIRKRGNEEYKQARKDEKYGEALGIDKIILIEPIYVKINNKKRESHRLVDSESSLQEFNERLKRNARLANLDLVLLESRAFEDDDVVSFNELSILKEWMGERVQHKDMDVVPLNYELALDIAEKYDVKNIGWSGLFTMKSGKDDIGATLCLSAMLVYPLPIALVYVMIPEYFTFYFHVLFDMESGKYVYSNDYKIKSNARNDVVNSQLYDTFYQISNSR